MTSRATIERLEIHAMRFPLSVAESDGTLAWSATNMVVVEAMSGGLRGVGYTYSAPAAAALIEEMLAEVVCGRDAMAVTGAWQAMLHAIRNVGRPGVVASAISAVDAALWDLKARLLGVPLAVLLGELRDAVPLYGSGGFTSLPIDRLQAQLRGWVDAGFAQVKMKVGRDPAADPMRVHAAREAIGSRIALFVDANGAYSRKQALAMAERFREDDVTWFEEPVSSDDLAGLRLLRDRAPAGMAISAGEYGYDPFYFQRMIAAGAVDVLQVDATRALGVTGALRTAALTEVNNLPLSTHTAPGLHLHLAAALPTLVHAEWFHDHVAIERELFDGAPSAVGGCLRIDRTRPGTGLSLNRSVSHAHAA